MLTVSPESTSKRAEHLHGCLASPVLLNWELIRHSPFTGEFTLLPKGRPSLRSTDPGGPSHAGNSGDKTAPPPAPGKTSPPSPVPRLAPNAVYPASYQRGSHPTCICSHPASSCVGFRVVTKMEGPTGANLLNALFSLPTDRKCMAFFSLPSFNFWNRFLVVFCNYFIKTGCKLSVCKGQQHINVSLDLCCSWETSLVPKWYSFSENKVHISFYRASVPHVFTLWHSFQSWSLFVYCNFTKNVKYVYLIHENLWRNLTI